MYQPKPDFTKIQKLLTQNGYQQNWRVIPYWGRQTDMQAQVHKGTLRVQKIIENVLTA